MANIIKTLHNNLEEADIPKKYRIDLDVELKKEEDGEDVYELSSFAII